MEITRSIAFVTGANGGIGQALVDELIARGAIKVYAAARNTDSLEAIQARHGPRLVPIQLDVTDIASVSNARETAVDVNLVINNAGFSGETGALSGNDSALARREMDVNYFGPLNVSRAFAPTLGRNGGGAIVNVLSFLSLVNLPLMGTYSASKAAALSLTHSLRAELRAHGTMVVAAMPVQVDTAMGAWTNQEKVTAEDAALDIIDAIENNLSEVFPGGLSRLAAAAFAADPKALQAQLATVLPST
ncbi:SDR family NAD(P)-dependent oxidoreductase [Rhizobium sp. BE258]|uniref:SDR family NAD(P)-dependent oxidoreductase n=1 Tax=Rhizobium sp. BE258 TaxID=2817722 RepID=UPI000DDB0AAA|nr:SDR family NAD(P)-dependent oxidoreductase [Rhizobium sp. BE258]MDR7145027.1 short-subunit dehydrogenase [Rhizobium sp. BE258]